jgi:hypothetical protein
VATEIKEPNEHDISRDITPLTLRGAALAIRGHEVFTIGQAIVNRRALIEREVDCQPAALLEAAALGQLMIQRDRRWLSQRAPAKVARIEPTDPIDLEKAASSDYLKAWNLVLGTNAGLVTPAKDVAGLDTTHSWRFRTYLYKNGRSSRIVGIGLRGSMTGLSSDVETQAENYTIPVEGHEADFNRLDVSPPVEDHLSDTFHMVQWGLLRAARVELGDKSVIPVIE